MIAEHLSPYLFADLLPPEEQTLLTDMFTLLKDMLRREIVAAEVNDGQPDEDL